MRMGNSPGARVGIGDGPLGRGVFVNGATGVLEFEPNFEPNFVNFFVNGVAGREVSVWIGLLFCPPNRVRDDGLAFLGNRGLWAVLWAFFIECNESELYHEMRKRARKFRLCECGQSCYSCMGCIEKTQTKVRSYAQSICLCSTR